MDTFLSLIKDYIFETIIFIAIIIVYFTISNLIKSNKQANLLSLVSWVAADSNSKRCNLSLSDYIYKFQFQNNTLTIDSKYRIVTNDERIVLKEILEVYKKDLEQKLFSKSLFFYIPKLYEIREKDFFAITLIWFLDNCIDKYSINGNPLYRYENTDNKEQHKLLTNHGLVIYKLRYILDNYCINNKFIKKFIGKYHLYVNPENFKLEIDKLAD